jgi:hypothetical protein
MSLPQSHRRRKTRITRATADTPAELSQLQRWFQSVVTHPEGVEMGAASEEAQRLIQIPPNQLERVITRSRALTAAERLAVYANAYHSRLMECLGEVYPALKRTLGQEGFDALAFGYLQQFPSRSYTLNELGRRFADYLEETRPEHDARDNDLEMAESLNARWEEFLVDLARLEWVIYEVFDGPGVEGQALLEADQLLAIPAKRWPQAKLVPVVCLTLLSTRFPVSDYFTALRNTADDEVLRPPAAADSFVAITRRDFVVRRYNLSRTEFELLNALKKGLCVDDALQAALAQVQGQADELAASLELWFRNWTAEGFFKSVLC